MLPSFSLYVVIPTNLLSSKINQSETNPTTMDTTLRYKIVSTTLKPQINSNAQKMQSTLIPSCNAFLQSQDQDLDMADSSLPSGTKRGQLIIHPHN